MEKPAINIWANFLANEKLTPTSVGTEGTLTLMTLTSALAKIRRPIIRSHKEKIESRRLVVITAMDLGIDLTKLTKPGHTGGRKIAMGRGLLDVWNEEYAKRFGSNIGTAGAMEIVRRGISSKKPL